MKTNDLILLAAVAIGGYFLYKMFGEQGAMGGNGGGGGGGNGGGGGGGTTVAPYVPSLGAQIPGEAPGTFIAPTLIRTTPEGMQQIYPNRVTAAYTGYGRGEVYVPSVLVRAPVRGPGFVPAPVYVPPKQTWQLVKKVGREIY